MIQFTDQKLIKRIAVTGVSLNPFYPRAAASETFPQGLTSPVGILPFSFIIGPSAPAFKMCKYRDAIGDSRDLNVDLSDQLRLYWNSFGHPALATVLKEFHPRNITIVFQGTVISSPAVQEFDTEPVSKWPLAVRTASPSTVWTPAYKPFRLERVINNLDVEALGSGRILSGEGDPSMIPDACWSHKKKIDKGEVILSQAPVQLEGELLIYLADADDSVRQPIRDLALLSAVQANVLFDQPSDQDNYRNLMLSRLDGITNALLDKIPFSLPSLRHYATSNTMPQNYAEAFTLHLPAIATSEYQWMIQISTYGSPSLSIPFDLTEVETWDMDRIFIIATLSTEGYPAAPLALTAGLPEFIQRCTDSGSTTMQVGYMVILPLKEVLNRSLTWTWTLATGEAEPVSVLQSIMFVNIPNP